MTDDSLVTGIAWYRRDQWGRLRELAADPNKLEESYDDWLVGAQKTLVQIAVTGVRAQRVDVDVDGVGSKDAQWTVPQGRRMRRRS